MNVCVKLTQIRIIIYPYLEFNSSMYFCLKNPQTSVICSFCAMLTALSSYSKFKEFVAEFVQKFSCSTTSRWSIPCLLQSSTPFCISCCANFLKISSIDSSFCLSSVAELAKSRTIWGAGWIWPWIEARMGTYSLTASSSFEALL